MMDENEIKEELYCINYEARVVAGFIAAGELERWLPGFSTIETEDAHVKRYAFASGYIEGKNVLDIACGTGMGSYILATEGKAASVTGIDIDEHTIRYARHRYKTEQLTYAQGDAEKYRQENAFDVITSFETVEHLNDYERYLLNINKSLKENGILLISTPVSRYKMNNDPYNSYHVREWGLLSFQKDVSKYLVVDKVYVQVFPYRNNFLLVKGIRRILGKKDSPGRSTIYELSKLPKDIKTSEFGKSRIAFQILVCRKKT